MKKYLEDRIVQLKKVETDYFSRILQKGLPKYIVDGYSLC